MGRSCASTATLIFFRTDEMYNRREPGVQMKGAAGGGYASSPTATLIEDLTAEQNRFYLHPIPLRSPTM